MKYRFKFVCLFVLSICVACSSTKQEVNDAVMNYFNDYKNSDFGNINRRYLSEELSLLIQQSIEREKREIEKTATGDYPTDKPFILEGDLFSSLYEGADSIRILSVHIKADTALADVMFYRTESQSGINWNDRLVLVKENGWKVDNVIFKSTYTEMKSTKDALREYIQAGE